MVDPATVGTSTNAGSPKCPREICLRIASGMFAISVTNDGGTLFIPHDDDWIRDHALRFWRGDSLHDIPLGTIASIRRECGIKSKMRRRRAGSSSAADTSRMDTSRIGSGVAPEGQPAPPDQGERVLDMLSKISAEVGTIHKEVRKNSKFREELEG